MGRGTPATWPLRGRASTTTGFALLALLAAACAGTGERPLDEHEVAPTVIQSDGAAKLVRTGPTRVHDPHRRGGYIVHSLNLTISTTDPAQALERARRVLEDLGGTIGNLSHHEDQGSLNAVVPPAALHEVRLALASVGHTVTNESAGRTDQTTNFNETSRRLDRIELARAEVLEALRRAEDPDAADGLGLLLELTAQERRNLIAQLNSFREQANGVQVYLSVMTADPPSPSPSPSPSRRD